jgi:hypothetical protein
VEQRSRKESNESQISEGTVGQRRREGGMETFEIQEEESNLRESQEVKNDLDALFHSDHDFDCAAL